MKAFLSSTFWDLRADRRAALKAIDDFGIDVEAMEKFIAKPTEPLKAILDNLRTSDFVVLVLGFRAGSLIRRRKGLTYTLAEYRLAKRLRLPVFAFIKTSKGTWRNDETDPTGRKILDNFHAAIVKNGLPRHFATLKELTEQVTAALRAWETDGRPGARRVFSTTDQHFRSVTLSPLFDYEQQLRGRAQQIAQLNDFIRDRHKTVALVKGRGGIGKSKLLRDWSKTLKGWYVLWVNDAASWSAEAFKEIPEGKVLIIHDDVHRSEILDQLLVLTRDLKERGLVKIALSFRPIGSHLVQGGLAQRIDEEAISHITPLEQLARTDVRELAAEVLGSKYRQYSPLLATVSRDTPLVTVVGGRLIARREISAALLANEEGFRRTVFDRFIEEQRGRIEDVGFDVRELLHLIAAVGPVSARDANFLQVAAKFLPLREDQVGRGIDALVRCGVLLRGGTLVRVVPDVLSDFLLEQACVNDRGETTGYADAVYTAFGATYLANLLRNVSELDWRIAQRRASSSSLLNDVWRDMERRFQDGDIFDRRRLLDAIQLCAMLQPAACIRLTQIAVEQPAKTRRTQFRGLALRQDYVIEAIPGVLAQIAYAPEYTENAVRELWRLAQAEKKDGPAGRALTALASYARYKPVQYNDQMADFANTVAKEPNAFDGAFTPLDIVDKLLVREVDFTEREGITIQFGAIPLNYPVVAPVRRKALAVIESTLTSESVRAAVRAVRSLGQVINAYLPRMRNTYTPAEIRWQTRERRYAIALVKRVIHREPAVPVPVLRQIKDLLLEYASRAERPSTAIARQVADQIKSDGVEIFDAFVSAEWEFDSIGKNGLFVSGSAQRQAQLEHAASLFAKQNRSVKERIECIERLFESAADAAIDAQTPLEFIEFLCKRDVRLVTALASRILGRKSSPLASCMQIVLRFFKGTKRYEAIAHKAARHPDVHIARAAAQTLFHLQPETVTKGELQLLRLLSSHKDWFVRTNVLSGLRFLAKDKTWKERIIRLALGVRLGTGEARVADEFANIFGPYGLGIDARATKTQVNDVLRKLLPIADLGGHNCIQLLAQWSATYPDEVFSFFLRRVERSKHARIRSKGYAAVPHDLSLHPLSKSADNAKNLKQLFELYINTENDWNVGKLFWAIAVFDDATVEVLESILRLSKSSEVKGVIALLHFAVPHIAFQRPTFARKLLETAETLGPDVLTEATTQLILNALPRMMSGSLTGEPPALIHMRDRADALIKEYASDRLLRPVYAGIRDMAIGNIERMKTSADDFMFENA